MARSQASNLSGMLGSIGDTLGKMGDTGNQYVDTFRRQMAPEAEMNDSASLLQYADWARRNGYDEEAKQYMALGYRQKEKEAQEAKDAALGATMAEAGNIGARGQDLGAKGDLGGADATVAQLRKKLADPEVRKNPDAVNAILQEISTLQQKRSEYVGANTKAIVQGVAHMDQQIATLSKEDPQYAVKKANYEAARASFLSRPEVEQAYESQKLELMETSSAKMDAMWKQQSPAILAEMRLAGTDVDRLQSIQNKYPQFASQIIAVEGTMLDLAERRKEIRAADFKIENLGPRIEREIKEIEDGDLPDPIKKQSIDLLNRAKGSLEGGKINPNTAIEAYDKARGQVDGLIVNEAAAQSAVIRQREQRAEVRVESAKQAAQKGPQPENVISLLELKTGKTWEKLNKENAGEAQRLYKETEAELMSPLLEYWERAEIAAGNEPYKKLDDEDVQTIKSEYRKLSDESSRAGKKPQKYEDFIQRKAYELAALGFERDAVTKLLSKETNMSLTDANEYYDIIMADIEVNDDRISEIVRELQKNPSGNESIASILYEETVLKRARGNRVVDPNVVSDDHATRTRKLLSDPDNLYQGVSLSPFKNKLASAYAEQNAGGGFRYPSLSELQPINKNNRVR